MSKKIIINYICLFSVLFLLALKANGVIGASESSSKAEAANSMDYVGLSSDILKQENILEKHVNPSGKIRTCCIKNLNRAKLLSQKTE